MQYRTKMLLTSKLRRFARWEFWPMSIFYIPVVIYIAYLSMRFRGLVFLSVNPGLPMSGLIGERKAASLEQLKGSEFLAQFCVLKFIDDTAIRLKQAHAYIHQQELSYPVVMKPDFGQRGLDVAVIRSDEQMETYLQTAQGDVILQEHINGEEFGVFYMRYPNQPNGKIFSITEKTFPVLVGDSTKTVEQLIMDNPRTHYMAAYLTNLHKDKLQQVLSNDERFKVVEIGSHCRGSVFLDGGQNITAELTKQIDYLSKKLNGFYFGRYDIRVPDAAHLQEGHSFKILEVNGVTSESTNIYDPENSVLTAYKILFKQWRCAFEIGQQNIDQGVEQVSVAGLVRHVRKTFHKF